MKKSFLKTENNKEQQQKKAAIPDSSSQKLIQSKLTVGKSNDKYEKQADAVAGSIIRMPQNNFAHQKTSPETITPFIQAKSETAVTVSNSVSNKISSSQGSGSSIDSNTQSFMSSRFGNDFSDVKIHTDNEAIQMNRELNAKAFTTGNNIYFNEGQYQPDTDTGKHLLAHELTHTLQQNGAGTQIQRTITENTDQTGNNTDEKAPPEKDMCTGWESDLESLTINAAKFHFATEHGESIQVEKMDCDSATSVKIKICDLTLSDGRTVRVLYNPERNIIRVQHEVSGVIKFCRYSYTCSYSGSVSYTKLDCNE